MRCDIVLQLGCTIQLYHLLTFPDSINGKLCGDPLSTKRTLKKQIDDVFT